MSGHKNFPQYNGHRKHEFDKGNLQRLRREIGSDNSLALRGDILCYHYTTDHGKEEIVCSIFKKSMLRPDTSMNRDLEKTLRCALLGNNVPVLYKPIRIPISGPSVHVPTFILPFHSINGRGIILEAYQCLDALSMTQIDKISESANSFGFYGIVIANATRMEIDLKWVKPENVMNGVDEFWYGGVNKHSLYSGISDLLSRSTIGQHNSIDGFLEKLKS